MKYIKPEVISLKKSNVYNEKWLQARIEEDPSIIGLGELDFRDTEKILVGGGRLDTILYDAEDNRRYEVEIQLGKTDETHIIRTIEYWDLERKKNPQYDHCAVIIAEDITSRFLNVISLFNGFIPLIAIQVKAIKVEDSISLFFTKVLDEVKFELLEEDIVSEPSDRKYWENRASKRSLKLVDDIYQGLSEVIGDFNLKYNKHYIGLENNDKANNFASFIPRKSGIIVRIKMDKNDEVDEILENADIETLSYDKKWKLYRLRVNESDLQDNLEMIKNLVAKAKKEYHN